MLYCDSVSTPWGVLIVTSDGRVLKSVQWENKHRERNIPVSSSTCPILVEAIDQLKAYIDGRLTSFSLPLEPADTDHSARFRNVMGNISYGQTITYKELGTKLGSGNRAVGQACKYNPFSIIVPCHRVISTGNRYIYYGGGPEAKVALIAFERTHS